MRQISQFLWILFGLLLILPVQGFAQQTRTYRVEVSTPIIERDFAFARKNAFQLAQNRILSLAIEDLVDEYIWQTFHNQITKKQSQIPKEYISAVKIHNEFSEEDTFHMVLEETVRVDLLSESLKKMKIILKTDPFYPITLIIDQAIEFPIDEIVDRLRLFHLDVTHRDKINLDWISTEDRNSKQFIEDLFAIYPDNGILYLTDVVSNWAEAEEVENQFEIRTRILRKSDLEELNTFSITLSSGTFSPFQFDDNDSFTFLLDRYLSLFTLQSIKRETYNQGLQSVFYISIVGLDSPYQRQMFEEHMIKSNSAINAFTLIQLAPDECRYLLQTTASPESFINEINKDNPYFDMFIMDRDINQYKLLAYPNQGKEIKAMDLWVPQRRILNKIYEAIYKIDDPIVDEMAYLSLDTRYIPLAVENEPNNSDITTNHLPYDEFVLGRVSSRADEDVYHLSGPDETEDIIYQYFEPEDYELLSDTDTVSGLDEGALLDGSDDELMTTPDVAGFDEPFENNVTNDLNGLSTEESAETISLPAEQDAMGSLNSLEEDATTDLFSGDETAEMAEAFDSVLTIEWIRIGKTTFSPQLRLYDADFNFINAFTLLGNQNRLEISHTFEKESPKSVYIRIMDRIGFIQGEIGGFKFYDYIVRYSWQVTPSDPKTNQDLISDLGEILTVENESN